jgi:hypothetical protein
MTFAERVIAHLARYKLEVLGIEEDGIYATDGRPRPHILPPAYRELTIIETYRSWFWNWYATEGLASGLQLRDDVRHLTSSQALCLNLFAPFVARRRIDDLPVLLGAQFACAGAPDDWGFECVLDHDEQTTFDFYARWKDAGALCVEVKYAEPGFGSGEPNAERTEKLRKIYRPRLAPLVAAEYLEEATFFANYQVLRNLSYISRDRHIVFVVPRANDAFAPGLQVARWAPLPAYRRNVHVVYLEDVVSTLISAPLADSAREHFAEFRRKYVALPPDEPVR